MRQKTKKQVKRDKETYWKTAGKTPPKKKAKPRFTIEKT